MLLCFRLETMQRSFEWVRGRLINVPAADRLLRDIAEYIAEVNTCRKHEQQASSSYQAPLTCSGGRGAPHYSITREQLSFLKSCGFSLPSIAEILQVSLATVKRRMKRFNLNCSVTYSDVTDDALDDMIKDIVAGNDQLGSEAVRAQLRAGGVRVQRDRVRKSLIRTSPRAAALRAMAQRRPQRRLYNVAGPNSLWHLDGNHKLIRWRIVIHGGIDGFSRLIVFLRASNNNRSSTVMNCFLNAVARYGVPSRIRTDHGGENNVCVMMNIFRGSERGSAIRGRSTHNQRIERLWGDMWRGLTNVYYNLFHFLES
ncbi:uncharacterized protein LOC107693586 [Sinocyclocheilus anshuiensis]|uniref:uncharacterized protein LOC107693586 n=1 Tax=Sinocyclocheilus anshuiensis TaxID=1608454 RepID=UPI0007B9B035|nr:PREDICTED: uncharacterized protein LOC107693586 [Sinocyclocheilus anshuiensis]